MIDRRLVRLVGGRVAVTAVMSAMLLAGSAAVARAQAPAAGAAAAPAKATLQQMAWITGAWSGTLDDRQIEQHWMAPAANSIVGMYRSIQKQQATLYELLAIEQEGDGLVLRIKHFAPGAGLVGREAKEESLNYPLVRIEGQKAVFESGPAGSLTRLTFTSPAPDAVTIVVERTRDGKLTATDFKYARVKR